MAARGYVDRISSEVAAEYVAELDRTQNRARRRLGSAPVLSCSAYRLAPTPANGSSIMSRKPEFVAGSRRCVAALTAPASERRRPNRR
ncbi:hypothetical protein [Amycolatopsis sp. WAC 01375]|uniref:hypothetical protein n=1 Tax=Amycolatopsis sp. WAC 01375 TaxID=2203194 RepID=UPI0018F6E00C|nr:hypothetical protein [Amycolatopsis sp. WAC 01375]